MQKIKVIISGIYVICILLAYFSGMITELSALPLVLFFISLMILVIELHNYVKSKRNS